MGTIIPVNPIPHFQFVRNSKTSRFQIVVAQVTLVTGKLTYLSSYHHLANTRVHGDE